MSISLSIREAERLLLNQLAWWIASVHNYLDKLEGSSKTQAWVQCSLNKSFSTTVALGYIYRRRFKTDTKITAEFFHSVWKIFPCKFKLNVREFDTMHLQFKFSTMFELDNCLSGPGSDYAMFWYLDNCCVDHQSCSDVACHRQFSCDIHAWSSHFCHSSVRLLSYG